MSKKVKIIEIGCKYEEKRKTKYEKERTEDESKAKCGIVKKEETGKIKEGK